MPNSLHTQTITLIYYEGTGIRSKCVIKRDNHHWVNIAALLCQNPLQQETAKYSPTKSKEVFKLVYQYFKGIYSILILPGIYLCLFTYLIGIHRFLINLRTSTQRREYELGLQSQRLVRGWHANFLRHRSPTSHVYFSSLFPDAPLLIVHVGQQILTNVQQDHGFFMHVTLFCCPNLPC